MLSSPSPNERLIIPLDFSDWPSAAAVVDALPDVVFYKVGLELYLSAGELAMKELKARGKKVFLDLKFHDIPNTVAQACRSALRLGADILNLHGLGGQRMMSQAAKALADQAQKDGLPRPALIAVTILTSMGTEDLEEVGLNPSPAANVVTLAKLAGLSGLDGVVASPQEISVIRKAMGKDFLILCPGIRPAWAETGDQRRTMTPREAIAAGADYIVVGRPITKAADPVAAAASIIAEMQQEVSP